MKDKIINISISLLLLIIGFVTYDIFIKASLKSIQIDNLRISTSLIQSQFEKSVTFGCVLASIPLLLWIGFKVGQITKIKQKVILGVGVFIIALFAWQFRAYQLNRELQPGGELYHELSIELEKLYFVRYLSIGLLIGTAMISLLFRRINKIEFI